METREIESQLIELASKKGSDLPVVFGDFLDYIIGFLNPNGGAVIEGWGNKYGKDDTAAFYKIMGDYFTLMKKRVFAEEWYDAFGDMFMSMHVGGNNKAQFFTPKGLCELMAEISLREHKGKDESELRQTPFGRRCAINDPACGSGRNLLAAHCLFIRKGWRQPYLVGDDLDMNCCKMTAINMAVHGCFGEVICHNTLAEPDKAKARWVINETMYPFPTCVPSIRRIDDSVSQRK